MKDIKVAVLKGGKSAEREISILSGTNVAKTLREKGYSVIEFDPAVDLGKIIEKKENIDVVFPVLHGKFGEDGTIQGFLELLDLKYVGSGVLSSALAMDKEFARDIFKSNNLLIPKGIIIEGEDEWEKVKEKVGLPMVIKPVANGSSYGVSIVNSKDEFIRAVGLANKFDKVVLAEEYIEGDELTIGVIGNDELEALPTILIRTKRSFFDYEAKYKGESEEIVPAPIPEEIERKAQDLAIRAHKVLKCRGMSRTDMIVRDSGIYLIETNTIPGVTEMSLLPKAAKAAGIDFGDLLERLIGLALEG